jgi:site-specific recombinase XerD
MSNKKISGLLQTYHKELSQLRNFSTDTVNTYLSCVHSYLEYATNELGIDPLQTTSEHLLEFILDLKASLSPSRLSHYRAALKGFFALLFNLDVITKNPADYIFPIKRIRSQRYSVVPEQLMFTLLETVDSEATAKAVRDHLMIALLWCLGLRSGELRSLRKKHIKIISVKEKTALLMVEGKGAKQRALLVVEKLYQKLIEYISSLKSNDLLFPGKIKDKILHDTTLNRRMARYMAKAGITERIHAHSLRHSFATEMYNAGVPLEDLRVMLGHENYRETSVYIHISQTQTMQALELLSIEGGTYGF